ncbi:MAG: 2OG-Fe(II) oxygenase [Gammaproteobacteria bacterium RIFCSPHIGHO2_12_FULL_41_20]|nr:MAG: 2OG-Fe(II) oxygenase [Gammaproteobacteria bacterium RIFCSPHIGHO2_12_FULL_41_20]
MPVLTVDYRSPQAPFLFCHSLKETGFAVLTHHPISTQLIEKAYQQWQEFFYSDTKHQYTYQRPSQDGYFPFRTEKAKNQKISDLKEFFHFYPWGKIPPTLKQVSSTLYEHLYQLAAALLQWVEDFLPKPVAAKLSMPLKSMIENSPNTLLRILHYPPLDQNIDADAEAVRAAAHEDINLITLLPAATTPGLEVLDTQGHWHAVTCDPGSIVVNIGDMLQMCTEYYYKSTSHRVVNPDDTKNVSRLSMPLFLHPSDNIPLSARYTAQQYLHERLRAIGIY